jgi:hypothetical protein
MNISEISSLEALDAIRSIPEWLRAVSNTASHLRRTLDVLEMDAAQFRTILESGKERLAPGSLAEIRSEGSELIAAIGQSAALMRRFQLAVEYRCPTSVPAPPSSTEVPDRVGTLTLTYVPVFVRINGASVSFTRKEERLLAVLWSARGSTLSSTELAHRIWSRQRVPQKTLSVHLARLRSKLEEFGIAIELIRGSGYRLVLASETRRR